MKTNFFRYALCASLIFTFQFSIFNSLQAQENESYNESVVVRGSYRPVIEQCTKLNFPATVADTQSRIEHNFQYSITPTRMKSFYEPSRIKAARIIGEPATKLYNNYIRLGFGNYWTPMADLYWSSTRDRQKTYGIRVNHISSWDRLPDYGPNHFGYTGLTIFGKYIVGGKIQLSSDLSYEHDHNLYYGFNDTTLYYQLGGATRDSISTTDYVASYNLATWNIGVRNMQLDPNKLGFTANLRLSDLWATWGQNEFNYNLAGDIHYGFPLMRQYKGTAYLRLEWDGYTHSLSPNSTAGRPLGCTTPAVWDTVRGFRNIIKVNPYVDFLLSGFIFHAGATAGWDRFTDVDTTVLRIFPDVVVSKQLMNGDLVLSLGATGGFDANNWNTIRLVNPYVVPGAEQRATRHYDFAAHARWTISRKLEANADIAYQLLRDDLTFALDSDYCLQNVYRPVYFDNNRLTVGGTVTFVNDEMLTLRAGGHYYLYTNIAYADSALDSQLSMLGSPLYRPDWDVLVGADVNYHDKWFFHLEGHLLGQMVADYGEVLPLRYGVNAQVEYRHNRALSFFLRMDNLAFQRYYYWKNYPSYRGLFLLGLTYTIPHN